MKHCATVLLGPYTQSLFHSLHAGQFLPIINLRLVVFKISVDSIQSLGS